MNISPELLEKVQKENEEFRGLFKEHATLKQKVEEFNKMKSITPQQEIEKKKHQKQKLSLVFVSGAFSFLFLVEE